jgi:hypothetical protein
VAPAAVAVVSANANPKAAKQTERVFTLIRRQFVRQNHTEIARLKKKWSGR